MRNNGRVGDAQIGSLQQLQNAGMSRRAFLPLLASAGATAALAACAPTFTPTPPMSSTLDEIDATTLGMKADDPSKAKENSEAINTFFTKEPHPPSGRKLVLPAGTIWIEDTIDLLNQQGASLRGCGINTTTLRKPTDGCLIKIAGFYNYIGDMTLDGWHYVLDEKGREKKVFKAALCGLYVQGWPQVDKTARVKFPTPTPSPTATPVPDGILSPTKFNTFRNLLIQGCRVGIRVGHHSQISDGMIVNGKEEEGEVGDEKSPDIVANLWQNIHVENNRYSLVRDGDNVLNDHFENFFCLNIDRHHVYLPRGGDFRCFTAQFGATLERPPMPEPTPTSTPAPKPKDDCTPPLELDYPKIYSTGGGAILLVNARSENNDPPHPQPPFLKVARAKTFAELHEVTVTNAYPPSTKADPKANPPKEVDRQRVDNLDIDLQSGQATLVNCDIFGTIRLANTQYIGLNNKVGRYDTKCNALYNTIILDALTSVDKNDYPTNSPPKEKDKPSSDIPIDRDVHLEVSQLTLKNTWTPERPHGSRPELHFAGTPRIDSADGVFEFYAAGGDGALTFNLYPYPSGTPQSIFTLKNDARTAVVETKGLNTGKAGDIKIRIDDTDVLKVTSDGLLVTGRMQVQGRSIGQTTIPVGATQLTVSTPAATDTSTILLTPLNDPSGVSLWISARAAGSFTISANPQLAAPITVQYLIIN